jgi:dihydroxyacetone kinase
MLKMTDEQRYSAVLKELGEVLQGKNTTISCQKWQIDELKAKLAAAEAERDDAKEELGIMNAQVCAMADEICKLKGGAA